MSSRLDKHGPRWPLGILALVAVVSLAGAAALSCYGSGPFDWSATGLPILPGTPEETVDAFLAAIARNDTTGAAELVSSHYGGVDGHELARQLADGISQTGALTRWLLVARQDGDPVLVTVYTSFTRAGSRVLTAEVFCDAVGWRVGNTRLDFRGGPKWRPPAWETATTPRLRLHAWPGLARDLTLLVETGEEAFDRALLPLAGAGEQLLARMSEPVDVYIYNSLASMSAAMDEALPDFIIGMWRGGAVHLVTPSYGVAAGRQPPLWECLAHELNHAVLSRYVQARAHRLVAIPAWLSEGMAGLAARQLSGPRRDAFAAFVASATVPSLEELAVRFTRSSVEYRYEYSFSFAEYLCGRFGPDALNRVVDAICDGNEALRALELVSGENLEQLTAGWHTWLHKGLAWTSPS